MPIEVCQLKNSQLCKPLPQRHNNERQYRRGVVRPGFLPWPLHMLKALFYAVVILQPEFEGPGSAGVSSRAVARGLSLQDGCLLQLTAIEYKDGPHSANLTKLSSRNTFVGVVICDAMSYLDYCFFTDEKATHCLSNLSQGACPENYVLWRATGAGWWQI